MSKHEDVQLSPADQRMLDALMEAGFDRAKLPQTLRHPPNAEDDRRAAAITRLLGYMDDYPVDDVEPALLHATMARIDRHEDQLAQRLRFDAALEQQQQKAGRGRRIRMPDFITVAAVILIAVGVLWPVLGSMRQQAMDTACANNLKQLGYAFSQYASENNGSLPLAMAGPMGTWDTFRNMINLNPLVKGRFCKEDSLTCPGHDHNHAESADDPDADGPSYSYRWFTGRGAIHWNTGPTMTVILGDLNPLIDAARSGWAKPPLSVSVNHGGRGQNVLMTSGETMWLQQPLVGRADNIWMPNNVDRLRPGAVPSDDLDVFLAH